MDKIKLDNYLSKPHYNKQCPCCENTGTAYHIRPGFNRTFNSGNNCFEDRCLKCGNVIAWQFAENKKGYFDRQLVINE